MYQLFLSTHIIGALIVAAISLLSITVIIRNQVSAIPTLAISVAVGSIAQIISGIALVIVTNTQLGIVAVCSKIAVYVAILAVVEAALYLKYKSSQNATVAAPMAAY